MTLRNRAFVNPNRRAWVRVVDPTPATEFHTVIRGGQSGVVSTERLQRRSGAPLIAGIYELFGNDVNSVAVYMGPTLETLIKRTRFNVTESGSDSFVASATHPVTGTLAATGPGPDKAVMTAFGAPRGADTAVIIGHV